MNFKNDLSLAGGGAIMTAACWRAPRFVHHGAASGLRLGGGAAALVVGRGRINSVLLSPPRELL
jgi:hypothetical protein